MGPGPALIAIGSRDPITAAQMVRLCADHPDIFVADCPAGAVPAPATPALPALLRCGGADADPAVVAGTFAGGILRWIEATSPRRLLVGGGDTALALFTALGARVWCRSASSRPEFPLWR
ncbi:hypothetical protein [Methylobrevis pamukkalensis]|uniref:Four-carbon acid sugar kinase nucleotide binding domain-containing protein n=1 Tax=Methylobrevis pamukkalensis TaxID=1439726 RepID=A0A1E3H5E8_9HYPH|nr:hypothetical protein [Methylobrevis pamukkalensis]ODN71016.1 hypothetical protein A6302_01650 [Methylobrevis pamukkalensis]